MRCHHLPSRRSARQEESDFEATNWLGEILTGWAVLLLGGRPPRRRRAGRLADGGDADLTGCECVEQMPCCHTLPGLWVSSMCVRGRGREI